MRASPARSQDRTPASRFLGISRTAVPGDPVENLSIGKCVEIAAGYTKQSENKFFKLGM
jgi:hypothetical protein